MGRREGAEGQRELTARWWVLPPVAAAASGGGERRRQAAAGGLAAEAAPMGGAAHLLRLWSYGPPMGAPRATGGGTLVLHASKARVTRRGAWCRGEGGERSER